jgi:tetratricopeptide (TPR) repeat protein
MTRFGLFAVPLVFVAGFIPGIVHAQQVPNGPLGATPADTAPAAAPNSPAQPKMTARERAEMNAEILMARKEFDEAAKAYLTILIDDPHNSKILNATGIAFQELGDGVKAEHYYRLAARADKRDSNPLNNLGTVEFAEGRYGKAIKYYKQAISKGNPLATIYTNLGYAYCSIREYPKAMVAFGQALAIDPEVFDHKSSAGNVLQQRSSEDPAPLHFMLAKSYAKIGDAARAARYLKMARDEGYKDFKLAEKDPDFAKVIKDPQIQEVLTVQPAYAVQPVKAATN